MWIFTIVAATAVVGTVIWLDWPRWKAWATDTTPPRHRATADDIEHHANVLIARLEEELYDAAHHTPVDLPAMSVQRGGVRYGDMQTLSDWIYTQPDFDTSIKFNERGE